MFFTIIKKLLPQTLFARFFLIIVIPTIVAQLFSAYMFYERHWSNVNHHMLKNLVDDITTIAKIHQDPSLYQNKNLINIIDKNLGIVFKFIPSRKIAKNIENISPLYYALVGNLSLPTNVYYHKNESLIMVEMEISNGILNLEIPKKRLENPTTYIFISWMMGAAALFSLFSLLFLKNQLKSISKLADAAQLFGTGRSIDNFKPSGALEVRKAGAAFIKMKERIERQITQRTEMLAGVSHDLRTPLTRMKLQLAMMTDNEETQGMIEDVIEMEKMIQHYLDFARGEGGEKSVLTNVSEIINICASYYKARLEQLEIVIENDIYLPVKINAIKRAFSNILENTAKYANKAIITSYRNNKYWITQIEDNGPGIHKSEIKRVFNAFYRIDNSRNSNRGGVGLGLSISKDIIIAHGGKIFLRDSAKLGGLRVVIRIPL
jgi:two-component system osmolarity sensor histidine kinase EnvZ